MAKQSEPGGAMSTPGAMAPLGRLVARPRPPANPAPAGRSGVQPLGLDTARGGERDALIYVPAGYRPDRAAPLIVMLHGAGGAGRGALTPLLALADSVGAILLAPSSREQTWDVIVGGFGEDVALIDRALAWTFERYAVDAARVVAAGFSDGASYALSIAVGNGDLFTHIVAFSPGFMAPPRPVGRPRVFVSHGTRDRVLPIDRCSRRLVPRLREAGYEVRYDEFDGGHTVPPSTARAALAWLAPAPR